MEEKIIFLNTLKKVEESLSSITLNEFSNDKVNFTIKAILDDVQYVLNPERKILSDELLKSANLLINISDNILNNKSKLKTDDIRQEIINSTERAINRVAHSGEL